MIDDETPPGGRDRPGRRPPLARPAAPGFRHARAPEPCWLERAASWPPGAHLGAVILVSLALWGVIGAGAGALLAGGR